jgi:hypothetical protein
MDVGVWLRSLGLERYEAALRKNEIDKTFLPRLTAGDLKRLLGTGATCSTPLRTYALTRSRKRRHPTLPEPRTIARRETVWTLITSQAVSSVFERS